MTSPVQPTPPPELKRLEPMIGTWAGTVQIVPPSEMKGGSKAEWTLGGMYLREDGWFEMPDAQKVNYVNYITWDAKAKVFRTWYFSDRGERGEGQMTVSADGKEIRLEAKGFDAQGGVSTGEGAVIFPDEGAMEFTWRERNRLTPNAARMSLFMMGEMVFKGTSKRQP